MRSMTAFILNSVLLGVALAMDAFSVSMANGLSMPGMSRRLRVAIPLTFAFFQFLMPMIGWLCVRTVAETFMAFQRAIPWIALGLLSFIGVKMLSEGIRGVTLPEGSAALGPGLLAMQGLATSIDALSVGFTIAEYHAAMAFAASAIIAAVTYVICAFGLRIGRRFASILAGRASILGGLILIGIGLEIFIQGL